MHILRNRADLERLALEERQLLEEALAEAGKWSTNNGARTAWWFTSFLFMGLVHLFHFNHN
jgi:hypothetical protein